MQLVTDINRDARHPKTGSGSYEWWYFDGISEDGTYQIAIVFYDGCPFSPRYIKQAEASPEAEASQYPAAGVFIYYKGKPLFYSLNEYAPDSCNFSESVPAAVIGGNSFRFSEREIHGSRDFASYDLRINERLPSGLELKGIVTFIGLSPNTHLLSGSQNTSDSAHLWNLVFPRAELQCRMNLLKGGILRQEINFNGTGYHDHNTGTSPMRFALRDWYRGWASFPQGTLVYNVAKHKKEQVCHAWLLSRDNRRMLHALELSGFRNRRTSGFLLRPARKLHLRENELDIIVNHKRVIDSGPFSCRYLTRASMRHPSMETEHAQGLAEYYRPYRFHQRLFWPLVNRRLGYVKPEQAAARESPHLYREI